jgi:malate dehydrogenase (oxaloacetate-decarboxylating)
MGVTESHRTRWNEAEQAWETTARGREVLADPRLNRGTAFTASERRDLGLVGLVPPQVLTLEQQCERAYAQYASQPTNLAKHVNLTALHDRNEVLFFCLVTTHLAEMLPIVYTPTVAEAIQRYSHEYRRPRGVYLSVDAPDDVERALLSSGHGPDDLDLIVATDAEAILGIGDWGIGGIDIAVGKLAVYTAAAGIHPARTLAVMLDVGTDRPELLEDPLYLGNRHSRVPREQYDTFVDRYVETATRLFPSALLHWEDFGAANARRILSRYRDRILTFNDDIQGTGGVNLAAVLAGVAVGGTPLHEHRVIVFGSGTAGIGIADQLRDAMAAEGLTREEATRRFWCLDRQGLLLDDMADLHGFQAPYARPAAEAAGWTRHPASGAITLEEVVRQVRPTVLIGTSAQGGAFTEPIVRAMASTVDRPIIVPMSNPTHLAEARPEDLIKWTLGRALVATGSPFAPVVFDRTTYVIGQANNALIFPGLGLGSIVARARRITDGMIVAAARAIASLADVRAHGASLLPVIADLSATSTAVAEAVVGAAIADGVAGVDLAGGEIAAAVAASRWSPEYLPIHAV